MRSPHPNPSYLLLKRIADLAPQLPTHPYDVMRPLAQVNRTLPQAAASSSSALANVLVVAITADGNFTASLWRGSTGQWTESQRLSFSNQNGTLFWSGPEVNIPVIAMKTNHRLYGITADEAGIVAYE